MGLGQLFFRCVFFSALRLQTQFEEMDTDKSGTISKKELKKALKKEGNLTEWEIIEFVDSADKDGDGEISMEEWLDAMLEDAEENRAAKGLVSSSSKLITQGSFEMVFGFCPEVLSSKLAGAR